MAYFCKKCGQEMAEDSAFCSRCGTPIQKENEEKERTLSKNISPIDGKGKKSVGCFGSLAVLLLVVLIGLAVWTFYGNSHGYGKDGEACALLTKLLHQNFGDNAAKCKSFTVNASPKMGLWIPYLGMVIGGRDIGTAELSNGTIMHDIIFDYGRDNDSVGVHVNGWEYRQKYLENPDGDWW